ncbi:MAG: cytochrome c oxidase subunit 3 [Myxococcaceae bacterium]
MKRIALDVKALPDHAFGHRDPMWWGVMGMIAIEATVFALLIASYYFLRGYFPEFPTVGIPPEHRLVATVGLALLLLSGGTQYLCNRACLREELRPARTWLLITALLTVGFLVCRYFEFKLAPLRWDADSYGSLLWMAYGLHTTHGIFGTLEDGVFLTLFFKGPVEKKHFTDLHANGTYWYFVVASWVVLYGVLYLDPGLFNR